MNEEDEDEDEEDLLGIAEDDEDNYSDDEVVSKHQHDHYITSPITPRLTRSMSTSSYRNSIAPAAETYSRLQSEVQRGPTVSPHRNLPPVPRARPFRPLSTVSNFSFHQDHPDHGEDELDHIYVKREHYRHRLDSTSYPSQKIEEEDEFNPVSMDIMATLRHPIALFTNAASSAHHAVFSPTEPSDPSNPLSSSADPLSALPNLISNALSYFDASGKSNNDNTSDHPQTRGIFGKSAMDRILNPGMHENHHDPSSSKHNDPITKSLKAMASRERLEDRLKGVVSKSRLQDQVYPPPRSSSGSDGFRAINKLDSLMSVLKSENHPLPLKSGNASLVIVPIAADDIIKNLKGGAVEFETLLETFESIMKSISTTY